MRSSSEIFEQIDRTFSAIESGTSYPGMSYEEGVRAALEWVSGDSDELPMEDE